MTRLAALPALLLILLITACQGSDGEPSPTPADGTSEASPTPDGEATTETTATPESDGVDRWTVLEPKQPPRDLAVYVGRGCWGCDGPTTHIERMYVDSAGIMRSDHILGNVGEGTSYMLSGPLVGYDGALYATTCSRGYCGGLGGVSPDAQSTLWRSNDGGVTWTALQRFDRLSVSIPGVLDDSLLLHAIDMTTEEFPQSTFLYPSGDVTPPAAATGEGFPTPMVIGNEVHWHAWWSSVIWDSAGNIAYDLAARTGLDGDSWRIRPVHIADGGAWMLVVAGSMDGKDARFINIVGGEVEGSLEFNGDYTSVDLGHVLDDSTAVGNLYMSYNDLEGALQSTAPGYPLEDATFDPAYQHSFPATIDVEAGEVTPLELFGRYVWDDYVHNRNFLVYAVEGPFMRIETGDDECLNVRSEPSLDGAVVQCLTSGVLLVDREEEESIAGVRWRAVRTPMGDDGWAAAEFLEE